MKILKLAAAALIATALSLGSAHAQEVEYEDETVFDFEGSVVEGQLIRPDGENIMGTGGREGASLIRIRQDFIPEMVTSVEDL